MSAKKSQFSQLARMAMVDGHIDEREKDLLFTMAAKLGLTQKEFAEVMVHSQDIPFVIPTSTDERFQQLYDLVRMMMVDDTHSSDEMELCHDLARKLGFDPVEIPAILQMVMAGIAGSSGPEELKRHLDKMGYI